MIYEYRTRGTQFLTHVHERSRKFVQKLADEKGPRKEFALYNLVRKLAPKVIANERHIYKGVSANIDFTADLYIACWGFARALYSDFRNWTSPAGVHRLEELVNAGKIIRPAYKKFGKTQTIYTVK